MVGIAREYPLELRLGGRHRAAGRVQVRCEQVAGDVVGIEAQPVRDHLHRVRQPPLAPELVGAPKRFHQREGATRRPHPAQQRHCDLPLLTTA
jgi:hypothetical protein